MCRLVIATRRLKREEVPYHLVTTTVHPKVLSFLLRDYNSSYYNCLGSMVRVPIKRSVRVMDVGRGVEKHGFLKHLLNSFDALHVRNISLCRIILRPVGARLGNQALRISDQTAKTTNIDASPPKGAQGAHKNASFALLATLLPGAEKGFVMLWM